ncbi:MAG: phosphomannomutase/phosphoglucomutase, partial [Candidatus Altiarchaeales archaeon]|nr:phosphomannomutase/phosphoglucomutase [Candidatus Altiarchaeales archaeon]
EILDDYARYIKERITVGRKLKVVVDAGNGVGGRIAEKIIGDLGCEVSCLYCDPDGNFPNHVADPTVDEYLTDLIRKVREEEADIGIAYDGDADRVGFVDDKGGIIRGDQSLILFSREILDKEKGLKIIFEVKCSQALIEDIEEHGGIPIMYRTGHSFIKKRMREEDSPLAGEMSGHFFFADNYLGYDDGLYASVRMIQLLSRSDKKLSEIIAGLPHYYSTPEIRVKCPDEEKFSIVAQVVEKFKQNYEVITVDGARVQFNGGWGLVRASNTEPAIILRFEADTEEKLQEIKDIILSELRKYPPLSGI